LAKPAYPDSGIQAAIIGVYSTTPLISYMSTRLDRFNTLPPKPEHSKKVLAALRKGDEHTLANLVAATGLSRTQVLCALDPMVRAGKVSKATKSLTFALAPSVEDNLT